MVKNINITGAVDSWFAWQVKDAVSNFAEREIHLVVTSNGGSVAQAIAISDMLARHGNVTVEFSGFAASAATWLAFGAKKVTMHEDTLWLCHQSSTPVFAWESMNSDELDAYIKKLESEKKSLEVVDAIIAKKYLDRCKGKGKNLKDVTDLMKEARYLAPKDCLEWGFVDELLPCAGTQNVVNQAMLDAFNLPPMMMAEPAANVAEPAQPVNEESLITKIVDRLKEFFGTNVHKTEDAAEEHEKVEQSYQQNNEVMNKTFVNVMALLALDSITECDGKLTLSMEQMAAVEKRLEDAAKAEKGLNEVSGKVAGMSGLENKVAALTLVLDRIPVGNAVPSKAAEKKQQEETLDIQGSDEVNEFVKSIRK